ncbi:MAG: hypothetical protein P8020_04775 [Acidobacteriota bacterium]
MREHQSESVQKGFCTFCMGTYDALRIGAHVARCSARRDDADCVNTGGREHPMAFLLMGQIEGWPEAWLCLEAHGDLPSRQLEHFIRLVWFPEARQPGCFSSSNRRLKKRIEEIGEGGTDLCLDEVLKVRDRFRLTVTHGSSRVVVNLRVVSYLRTAVMDMPIELAAFPSGDLMGRKPARDLCPGLWDDGIKGIEDGASVATHESDRATERDEDLHFDGLPNDSSDEELEEYFRQMDRFTQVGGETCLDRLIEEGIEMPPPEDLTDKQITAKLWEVVRALEKLQVYITSTDHLSDRELYTQLWGDLLREEAMISAIPGFSWNIDVIGSGSEEDIEIWLRYYADEETRQSWAKDWPDSPLPKHEDLPYDRDRLLASPERPLGPEN